MASPLPPFAAIRVFEATARLMSFTRAAQELGMTQAAVSYQIRLLEERLGAKLFLRKPREISLTEAGRRLAPRTTEAFDILRDTYARFADRGQGTLTVNTMHTFAQHWLAPRLGGFQLAHPTIAVRLETTGRLVDFAREEVDVVIRAGYGKWDGLVAHELFPVRFTPMLSPAAAEQFGPFRRPEDLLKVELLDADDPWWAQWFAGAGLAADKQPAAKGIALGIQALDASAAMAGRGAAILCPDFFEPELAAGRLVQPFDVVVSDGSAYWLAYPESRRGVPVIRAFRDWILGELEDAPP